MYDIYDIDLLVDPFDKLTVMSTDEENTPEIAQEEQALEPEASQGSSTSNSNNNNKKRNGRHGARNQHRHKNLCKWIMETFDLQKGDLVVDVAGGKGELAARLTICHQLRVLLVDPRPADVPKTFETLVLPKLPKRHQERWQERCADNPDFMSQVFTERFDQVQIYFDDSTLASNEKLKEAMQSAKVIIGMHADGATEYIVDAALQYGKPFVVVPCCVFPNLFNQRFLFRHEKKIPVRSHEQFCAFLLEKDARFRREVLPFEGRNVAIIWNGVTG